MKLIEGKVAHILSEVSIAINVGSEAGVTDGSDFDVLAAREIVDPDTKQVLGTMDFIKASVRVTEVHELYSVAETYKYTGGFGGSVGLSIGHRVSLKRETLKLDDLNASRTGLSESDSYVKVGDRVVQRSGS